jgi:hypothetical protein
MLIDCLRGSCRLLEGEMLLRRIDDETFVIDVRLIEDDDTIVFDFVLC